MKLQLALIVCLSGLLLLSAGCFTSRVVPYAGQQQTWPTAAGSFVTTNTAVPVYFGLPPRPYIYLAQIEISDISGMSLDVVQEAARTAKARKAHALLVLDTAERPVGSYGSGSAYGGNGFAVGTGLSAIQYGGQIKAIAIQWKTNPPAVP